MRFLLFLLLLLSENVWSQNFDPSDHSVVTDPSISRRCKALMKRRKLKIRHKQKISALIERNTKLTKVTPLHKKSIIDALNQNKHHLQNELVYTKTRIKRMEEDIIRGGCPGLGSRQY